MTKLSHRIIGIFFIVFLSVFFLLNLFTPDVEFSAQENTYLQMLPGFSRSSLFSGRFTNSFENTVPISSLYGRNGSR